MYSVNMLLAANVLIQRTHYYHDVKIPSSYWNYEIKAPFKKIMAWDALFFSLGIGVGVGIGVFVTTL